MNRFFVVLFSGIFIFTFTFNCSVAIAETNTNTNTNTSTYTTINTNTNTNTNTTQIVGYDSNIFDLIQYSDLCVPEGYLSEGIEAYSSTCSNPAYIGLEGSGACLFCPEKLDGQLDLYGAPKARPVSCWAKTIPLSVSTASWLMYSTYPA